MKRPDNFVLTRPHDFAIYLPAVNPEYADVINTTVTANRPLPPNFDIEDLEFWTGNSKLWNHKFLLHSIGGYKVGTDTRGALFSKKPDDFCMVGDSGGFQIGKGTLRGTEHLKRAKTSAEVCELWRQSGDIRKWILQWLEANSDYAMTIDMPLWARFESNSKTPFHKCSVQELIDLSIGNLDYIKRNARGKTKWLNVLQGTTAKDSKQWWDAVKGYRMGGDRKSVV